MYLCSFHIAGNKWAPGDFHNLDAGDEFDVVPEPDNPHDDKALRCDYGGVKYGYIPRPINEIFIVMIEQFGVGFTLRVKERGKGVVLVDMEKPDESEPSLGDEILF